MCGGGVHVDWGQSNARGAPRGAVNARGLYRTEPALSAGFLNQIESISRQAYAPLETEIAAHAPSLSLRNPTPRAAARSLAAPGGDASAHDLVDKQQLRAGHRMVSNITGSNFTGAAAGTSSSRARGAVELREGGRDAVCPVCTGGGTRRVQLVRGEGRGVSD